MIDVHRLVFCTGGTATCLLDDRTGARLEGSTARLDTGMRLSDAPPEVAAISPAACAMYVQDEVRALEYAAPLIETDVRRHIGGVTSNVRTVHAGA